MPILNFEKRAEDKKRQEYGEKIKRISASIMELMDEEKLSVGSVMDVMRTIQETLNFQFHSLPLDTFKKKSQV